jgi:hypothetical protein
LAGTVILDVSYDYEVKDDKDKYVNLAEAAVSDFTRFAPLGTFIIDAIPFHQFASLVDRDFRIILLQFVMLLGISRAPASSRLQGKWSSLESVF